jgi:mannose-6-phosphate isomerase-like protein (cupin superfamily)
MIPEAKLEATEFGMSPTTPGWFVLNARDARWAETLFPMLGMAIRVVHPGEPTGTYHWETEQEDFLVLAGEGVLIVEGEERPVRRWDFVHCPPGTKHAFAGAGSGPCVILCASSRQFQEAGPWGFYCVDETAALYNAISPEETQDGSVAYARFADSRPSRYRSGLLPD